MTDELPGVPLTEGDAVQSAFGEKRVRDLGPDLSPVPGWHFEFETVAWSFNPDPPEESQVIHAYHVVQMLADPAEPFAVLRYGRADAVA